MKVITISVPEDVLQKVEQAATAAGMNRSQFIVSRVSMAFQWETSEDARKLVKRFIDEILLRAVVVASAKFKEGLEPTPEMVSKAMGLDQFTDIGASSALAVHGGVGEEPRERQAIEVVATARRPFKRAKAIRTSGKPESEAERFVREHLNG